MRVRASTRLVTAIAAGLLVTGGGVASADDISNKLDNTVDAVAEVMSLNVGGRAGTTALYVTPTNGDGKNGCNLTGSTTLVLDVESSNPAVATVSPSSITFTSCSDTPLLTVTPLTAGSSSVTVKQASNSTGGTFDLAPAAFTVNVARPANTAPRITVSGVAPNGSYAKGSVPDAVCSVTDAEDGAKTFPATLSAVTGPHAADGIGGQEATCSYTDAGGLTAQTSETYRIVDLSAPAITPVLSPSAPDGDNGWYRGNVALDWTVTEPESPNSLSVTGCDDLEVTADQSATTYGCAATSAGGPAGPETVTVKRDGTAPTVTHAGTVGTQGQNGWYTSDVTATFTAEDALSGPASASRTVTSTGEGAAVSVASPAFSDAAGNTTAAGAVAPTFAIDLTDPTATFSRPIGSVHFGSVPEAPTCRSVDSGSGPAPCTVTGYSTAVGTHTLTATARDQAGRTGTATQQYTVLAWTVKGFYSPVDLGGVYNTVKGGSTVPVKFELFAASTELTSVGDVTSVDAVRVNCVNSAPVDEVETLAATGGTGLRYDSTSGQFVYNWKTPTGAGTCYQVTMTARDGSTQTALFKLK
ncbi:PxKF domain-containing protein [Geodermatophilus sp. SYSU D00703]